MPKVSTEYTAARRRHILATARALFAERGFARTSMGDISAAAGLSAGAVYRYFPSRDDLVLAVCQSADAPPADTAEALIDRLLAQLDPATEHGRNHARLVCQIYGEAVVQPELAEVVARGHLEIRDALATLARSTPAADLITAALTGYATLVATGAPVDPTAFRRSLLRIVTLPPIGDQ